MASCGMRQEIIPQPITPPETKIAVEPSLKLEIKGLRTEEQGYLIGTGDVLRISIWNQPDLSAEVTVSEKHTIVLPILGEISVEGHTVDTLREYLTEEYSQYIKNPMIDVTIKEYGSKFVYIFGEVKNPGAYPLKKEITLLESIAVAGGPTDDAFLGCAYLIRKGNAYPIDLYSILRKGQIKKNIFIEDRDIIYIPSVKDQAIYVVGEVNNPGPVAVKSPTVPLLEALLKAGGVTFKSSDEVVIVKGAPFNTKAFRLKGVKNGLRKGEKEALLKFASVMVQPGDIILVPKSGIATWNEMIEMIKPTIELMVMTPLRIFLDYAIIRDYLRRQ